MLLTFAAVLIASLLLVGTTLQSTYPDHAKVRAKWFKVGLISTALLSSVLLVVTSISSQLSQQKMEDAIAGVSKTVFDRDLEFHLAATYRPVPGGVGFVTGPFVIVSVIPKESGRFCEIGVTSTPVVDSFYGQMFLTLDPAPGDEVQPGFGDPTASQFKFQFSGSDGFIEQRSTALPLFSGRRMSLDEYETSQFIVELHLPGKDPKVEQAVMYVKGKPVPFQIVKSGDRFLGSTIFRPTWETRCMKQKKRPG